jgi:hypothetical protein
MSASTPEPPALGSHPGADPIREAELVAIAEALSDPEGRRTGLTAAALRDRVNARSWSPGRFAAALHHAVATGAVIELGDGRYAMFDPHP